MTSFGGQTITIATTTPTDPPTYDELGHEIVTTDEVDVGDCRHRPLNVSETPEWITNVGTQVWKTTAPPVDEVLALGTESTFDESGVTYQVIAGVQPFRDMNGNLFKCTILSKVQEA